jgi:hypothetical protein
MGSYCARERRILVQGQVRSTLIVILLIRTQQIAQMPFAKNNNMVEDSRRMEPISLSAYPFCQGERAEIGRSRMPIARMRRMKTVP